MSFKKLPHRYFKIILPLIISIFMSCVVSGISTVRSMGFDADNLFQMWMTSWGMSWIIAYPTLQVVMPTAKKITLCFVEEPKF